MVGGEDGWAEGLYQGRAQPAVLGDLTLQLTLTVSLRVKLFKKSLLQATVLPACTFSFIVPLYFLQGFLNQAWKWCTKDKKKYLQAYNVFLEDFLIQIFSTICIMAWFNKQLYRRKQKDAEIQHKDRNNRLGARSS